MKNISDGPFIGGRNSFLVLIVLCTVSLAANTSRAKDVQQKTAEVAISKGLKFYKQKKFAKSTSEFKRAIDINPQSASAHWNLARSLGMLRLTGKPCEDEAKQSIIIRHIFKACRIKSRLKRRLRKERAFRSVHDTVAWQRLMGLVPNKARSVQKILMNVSWYGPASDEGDPSAGMDFRGRSKVLLWIKDSDTELGRQSFQGKWRVQRNRVFVVLSKAFNEKKSFEGELKQTGELWLPGLPAPFTDDPLLCNKKSEKTKADTPTQ